MDNQYFEIKTWKLVLGAVLIVLICKSCATPTTSKKTSTEKPKQAEVKKETKKDINDMSIDEYMKSTDKRIMEIVNSVDNTGYYLIKYDFTSDKASVIASQVCKLIKDLQKHKDYSKIKKVGVMVMTDFTDTYGKEIKSKSLSIDIPKEELDKIKWDGFNYNNIYKLASDLYVHPTIKPIK